MINVAFIPLFLTYYKYQVCRGIYFILWTGDTGTTLSVTQDYLPEINCAVSRNALHPHACYVSRCISLHIDGVYGLDYH